MQLIINNFKKVLYLDVLVDKVSSLCFLLLGLFYLGEFIYVIFSSPQSRHTLKCLKNCLICSIIAFVEGFPGGSDSKESDPGLHRCVRKIPWRRK